MSNPMSVSQSTSMPVCLPGDEPFADSPPRPQDPFARPPSSNTCEPGRDSTLHLPPPDHPAAKPAASRPATAPAATPASTPTTTNLTGLAQPMRAGEVWRRGRDLTDAAVARMLREKGPELRDLQQNIERLERHSLAKSYAPQIEAFKAKRDAIIQAYNPSMGQSAAPRSSRDFGALRPETLYADDIVPGKGTPFGTYGGQRWEHNAVRTSVSDAYAYFGKTEGYQVANDLERLARAGYTQVHVATGTHGTRQGVLEAEPRFLREDVISIRETMQRHAGLTIVPYDMSKPAEAAEFYKVQALAAEGRLPGGATLASHCHSAVCLGGPPAASVAAPAATAALPATAGAAPAANGGVATAGGAAPAANGTAPAAGGTSAAVKGAPAGTQPAAGPGYAYGALNVGLGAVAIRDGIRDPNAVVGTAKIIGGGAQVIGGGSLVTGLATGSDTLTRFGAGASRIGVAVGGTMVLVDLHRDLQSKFDPQIAPVRGNEAVYEGAAGALKYAGALFPEAAVAAIVLQYGAAPLADKAAQAVAPTFVGGVSQAYGIPSQYVWGMH